MELYAFGAFFSFLACYCFSVAAYHSWSATWARGYSHTHFVNFGLSLLAAGVSLLVGAGSLAQVIYWLVVG